MPGNGILQLWVPVVILAHLYALFWLVKMYLLTNSAGTDKLRKAMGQGVARTDKEDRLTTAVASGAGASPTPSTSSSTHSSLPEISISLPVIRRLTTLTSQMRLEWRNLSCSYNTPRGPKEVLHGVYGTAAPGEMQAFIGPSGAGKSTLMDILAKRKSTGAMGGQILVNGKPPSNKFLKRTAYVPQDDNFIPTMTTEETLSFYADLVLPSSMSGAERRQRVLEVLEVLGLSGHRRTLVGGQLPGGYLLRGLSGGERKRLSVAAGILATPSVIFLDEPTSGLDSFAAMTVMMYMKRMASATGQIVIACIHQPRSAIWNMFDTVLVLAEGMMMYQGPREGMVPWFSEELHYAYDPLLHGVPCDWAMDLVCTAFQKPERYYGSTIRSRAELKEAASRFRDAYHRRECLVEGGEVFWQSPPTQEPEDAVQEPADHPMGGVVAAGSVQGPGNVQESGADVSVAPDIEDLGRPAPSVRLMRTGSARAVSWAVDMSEHEHKEEGPAGCGGVIGSIRRSTTASRTVMPTAEPAVPPSLAALPSLELLEVARAPALAALKPRRNATPAAPRLEQSGIRDLDAILAHAQPRWSLLAALGERLTSTWLFFRTLLWRELLMITRNPADVAGRMLTHAWVAIFVGLIFYNLSPGPESVRTRMNLVAIVPAFFLLMPYVSMSLFTADRSVFMADMSARLYSPGPYYVAKVVATTPFNIASALTFALITYGMAGLRHTPEAAFQNAVISCLLSLAALQVLHLAALIAPNQDGAFMLSIAWTALNLLMNPFFITSAEMVLTGLGQLRHISALAYGWEALLSTELGGRTFDCSKGFPSDLATLLPLLLPKTPLVSSPYVKQLLRSPGAGCIMDTDPVLAAFGLHNSYRMAVGVLLIYLAALHLLTFIALSLLARKKERR